MTYFSAVYVAVTATHLTLAALVIVRNPRAALNWYCALFLLALGFWGFGDIFFNLQPLLTLEQIEIFASIGAIGGYSFASMFLLFALALSGRYGILRSWLLYVPLAGLPLASIVTQCLGIGAAGLKVGAVGWVISWRPSALTVIYYSYYITFMVLGLILIIRHARAARRPRTRKQAILIFWASLATLLLGTITDVGLPMLMSFRIPPLAVALALIWSVGLFISMTRYGLMPVTVQVAARDMLATMLDSLLLLAPDGSTVVINQAGLDLLGYRPSELSGKAAAGLFQPPEDFECVFERVVAAGALSGLELNCRPRIGDPIPVAISARVMKDPDDTVMGSVWVLRDITEQKRAQLALAASESRYRALSEELALANEELKRLSEAKSDFVAAASHDLRVPLTTIIEGIALTEDGTLGAVNDEQRRFLNLAREDAERLSELIGNMLDVRKIEQGKMQARPVRLDASEVVRRIGATMTAYARDQGVTLEVRVPDEPLITWCDPGHLPRIVSNLVNNAVKFTPAGGRVTISGELHEGGVTVRVSDTGVGIPADQQHRIFGKFEQVQRDDAKVVTGTGLGLSLCKQLVEMNGGRIWFDSIEHQGSTFHFSLPAPEARAQTPNAS